MTSLEAFLTFQKMKKAPTIVTTDRKNSSINQSSPNNKTISEQQRRYSNTYLYFLTRK